jgi:hypothetical protein
VACNLSTRSTGDIRTNADLPAIMEEGLPDQPDIYGIIVDAYARQQLSD